MTLVATALCADRSLAAPPSARPEADATASRTLAARLSVTFRRCVSTVRLVAARRDLDRPAIASEPTAEHPFVAPSPLSPFEFRLPPPCLA